MADETAETMAASPNRAALLMRRATYAAVAVALVLITIKSTAWVATDSVSMLSTLVDSMLDAAASLINLFAVRHALQPADREHRFGHGKAEALAGLAQAAFIAGSGVFLCLETIGRFVTPRPIENGAWGVSVMIVSMVLTLCLVLYQIYVAKRTGSLAIKADAFHYRVDFVTNSAVIGSLILASFFDWYLADPLVALAIVVYMGYGAMGIARQAMNELMDRELPDEDRRRIREIALRHPRVRSVHDLRTRSSGPNNFVQIHLEMDRELTLIEAHEISDEVMYNVEAAFPNTEVLIHQDPEGVEERRDAMSRTSAKG